MKLVNNLKIKPIARQINPVSQRLDDAAHQFKIAMSLLRDASWKLEIRERVDIKAILQEVRTVIKAGMYLINISE